MTLKSDLMSYQKFSSQASLYSYKAVVKNIPSLNIAKSTS